MAPSKLWGITKKNLQLAKWRNYAKRTSITLLRNKKKREFTLERCKMLVDIGLVHLQFYLNGSDDSDEVGEHQDSNTTQSITGTRGNVTQSLTETTRTVTLSLAATTINTTQSLASTSSNMAMYKKKLKKT
jgi:hypothetical protein